MMNNYKNKICLDLDTKIENGNEAQVYHLRVGSLKADITTFGDLMKKSVQICSGVQMSINPSNGNLLMPDFFVYADSALACSISQAIQLNDRKTLRSILNKRKEKPLPLSADNRKWTALHVAASQPDKKKCLQMLLRYGDSVLIDLNAETFYKETALHIACENNCEENALILLRKGCDPKRITLDGSTALHIAASKGYHKIVEHLLNHHANLNAQDWQHFTPLHLSAMCGHFAVCRILLENDASVHLVDFYGNLPLHLACQNGHFDIVRLLLEHNGTLVNKKNLLDITPLMLAVRNPDVEGVRYLLDNGAKTKICSQDGKMALQFAAIGGNPEVLQLMLQSTNMSSIKRNCLFSFLKIMDKDRDDDCMFHSLTCCAITSCNADCLATVLNSKLPKSILEAPYAEKYNNHLIVYSPITYLLSPYLKLTDDTFDMLLNLLLKHNLTSLDMFSGAVNIKWPISDVTFVNPFSAIFDEAWPRGRKRHYFELLNANGITIDYCLQSYNNNMELFDRFESYCLFYSPVLEAVRRGDVDTVKLFMSTSVILEPDQLYNYLMQIGTVKMKNISEDPYKMERMYYYLTSLMPVYRTQQLEGQKWYHVKHNVYSNTDYFFPVNDKFTKVTLQQLCRTVIRQQLRGNTLQDNLRDFRTKITSLSLPISLKDYLLFKC